MSKKLNSPHNWRADIARHTRHDQPIMHASTRRTSNAGRKPSSRSNRSTVAVESVAEQHRHPPRRLQTRMFASGAPYRHANGTILHRIASGELKVTPLGRIVPAGDTSRDPLGRWIVYLVAMSFIVLWMLWGVSGGLGRMTHSSSRPPASQEMPTWTPQLPLPAGQPPESSPLRTSNPNAPRPTQEKGSGERPTVRVR